MVTKLFIQEYMQASK